MVGTMKELSKLIQEITDNIKEFQKESQQIILRDMFRKSRNKSTLLNKPKSFSNYVKQVR